MVPNAARRSRLLVVTNGPHKLVEATLDRLALAQHFEAIVRRIGREAEARA